MQDFSPVSSTWWRVYLARFSKDNPQRPPQPKSQPTGSVNLTLKRKARHRATMGGVVALFKHVFPWMNISTDTDVPVPGTVEWFGTTASNTPPSDALCRQIAWELFEIGFRAELLHLDWELRPTSDDPSFDESERQERVAAIFTNGNHIRPHELPRVDEGLAAPRPRDRATALEAFRVVVSAWPGCPLVITQSEPLPTLSEEKIEAVERALLRFYLQEFYEASGRAATVPHRYPFSIA